MLTIMPAKSNRPYPRHYITSLDCLLLHRTCFGRPTGKYKKALHAFNHLKEAIANAPDINPVLKEADKAGLTEDEAVLEILWMLK